RGRAEGTREELATARSQLEAAYAAAMADLDAERLRTSALERARATALSSATSLEKQRDDHAGALGALRTELAEATADQQRAAAEKTRFVDHTAFLERSLRDKDTQISSLREGKAASERERSAAQAEVVRLRDVVGSLERAHVDAERTHADLV